MIPATPASWQADVPVSLKGPVIYGLAAALLFFVGFGAWAASVPLSGAIMAQGEIRAAGQNLTVDHVEGGVIAAIGVHEGQRVKAGDMLLTVDTTRTAAERDRLNVALAGAAVQMARARAERDGLDRPNFSTAEAGAATSAGLTDDLAEQGNEFDNRLARHEAETAALAEQIRAAEEEIEGVEVQKTSELRKLSLLREDLRDKAELLNKGLAARGEVNSLRRAEADSLGSVGTLTARLGERRAAIAQLHQQIASLAAKRRETASAEVNDLASRMGDLRQQLRRQEDILSKSTLRAPAGGIIVRLSKNTVGSALKAGEPVVEILPTESELLVEARISPQDVDEVRVGQAARLKLLAFNSRTTSDEDGEVTYVSADRLAGAAGESSYYTARIRLAPQAADAPRIQPGMPVAVYIKTGDRTFLRYLLQPFLESFGKAFREK